MLFISRVIMAAVRAQSNSWVSPRSVDCLKVMESSAVTSKKKKLCGEFPEGGVPCCLQGPCLSQTQLCSCEAFVDMLHIQALKPDLKPRQWKESQLKVSECFTEDPIWAFSPNKTFSLRSGWAESEAERRVESIRPADLQLVQLFFNFVDMKKQNDPLPDELPLHREPSGKTNDQNDRRTGGDILTP